MKPINIIIALAFSLLTTQIAVAEMPFLSSSNTPFTELGGNDTLTEKSSSDKEKTKTSYPTQHKFVKVNGVDIFYREAGPKVAPTILLLHGYPTSSHMFRNLIEDLSDSYHLIAPDYPGYGYSEQPAMASFDYTFDNMALIVEGVLEKYAGTYGRWV